MPSSGSDSLAFRTVARRLGIGPIGAETLGRQILLAGLVGVVAGLGAVLFHMMTGYITHYGLAWVTGYLPSGPTNETHVPGLAHDVTSVFRPWMIPLVMTAGGLVSGWIVYRFAPEAEGHGTDAAIDAYHNRRGVIRPRVPVIKTIASAITLGTGGSGGREGPIAQIGAGFGSFLATRMRLPEGQRRMLLSAGVGAGIGSIFHAPLAGAIFAIEVLYRDPDFEAEGLIPAFIATTVSYSVFTFVFGLGAFKPLFTVGTNLTYTKPFLLLLPLAGLALLMTLAAQVYVRVFYGVHDFFHRLRMPPMLKPAVGALGAGLLGMVAYYGLVGLGERSQMDSLGMLHYGYGFLQHVIDPREGGTGVGAVLLLIVGFGKMVTTGMTIGSGGSGGVFGPSMVIGGSLGSVVGMMFHELFPAAVAETDVVVFAILGMASFFAAAAKTPVSTLIMVSELTSGYALLLPSMWVCALAYVTSGARTLYREQLSTRLESPAHRGDFIVDVVEGLTVRDALTESHRNFVTVPLETPLPELSRMMTNTMQTGFPVMNGDGRYMGLFSLNDIREFLYDSDVGAFAIAEDVAHHDVPPLREEMSLSEAIHRFAESRYAELPVVAANEPDRVVAMIRRQDVMSVYDRRLLELKSS